MARKKKHPAHENHERWLVSYADFITLLFAFFVVMFATSQTNTTKAAQVSQSVKEALENGKVSALVASILGGAKEEKGPGNAMLMGPGGAKRWMPKERKDGQLAELLPSLEVLSKELKNEIAAGKIQISMEQRGLAISFKQATLFPSGEDVIAPDAVDSIGKVASAINKMPNPVRLEGHTDSVPIHTHRFNSNWDLSAARSIALLRLLSERFGVPVSKLSVAGYADTAPVDSNETEGGRSRNRRCDIVILNETGLLAEPGQHGPAPGAPTAAATQR
jgi:chemotaxis protein MotB